MVLRILGSASGQAVPDRSASGYWIETAQHALLLDAGDGIARELTRYPADPRAMDAVVVSHMHPDHAAGLLSLLQQMHLLKRQRELILVLPPAAADRFHDVMIFFNLIPERLPFRLLIRSLSRSEASLLSDVKLQAIPNGHLNKLKPYEDVCGMPFESYSLSVRSGKRHLLYTADTDGIDALLPLMSPETTLLAECTHLDVKPMILAAAARGIRQIVLTHIPPEKEAKLPALCREASVSLQIAADGKELIL